MDDLELYTALGVLNNRVCTHLFLSAVWLTIAFVFESVTATVCDCSCRFFGFLVSAVVEKLTILNLSQKFTLVFSFLSVIHGLFRA